MNVEVHTDWAGRTHLVGRLYAAEKSAAVSFEYDDTWLARGDTFPIDPLRLPLESSTHNAPVLFSALQDCGPDRWGRVLIERAVRKGLMAAKPYHEIDFVLALDDFPRIGALRFRPLDGGPFLAPGDKKLPPVVRLSALLAAADAIHHETETARDLRFLLGAGSPVGGARPKSVVQLADGSLAIAKFPRPDDRRSIATGEILALALARKAGISTADHQLVRADDKEVAVITRFDRRGAERIPFISAQTLLGLSAGNDGSYVTLAEGIRRYGDQVQQDLREIFSRMVFSMLVCNRDDHLRNHGFLQHSPGRWSLSPAYDLNPVPITEQVHESTTPISEAGTPATVTGALSVANSFGLTVADARDRIQTITAAVSTWKQTAAKLGLASKQVNAYASAFEHPVIDEARTIAAAPVSLAAARPRRGISP